MQKSLFKLFEHKCVLEVCVHIHPIMIKIHPLFFFYKKVQAKLAREGDKEKDEGFFKFRMKSYVREERKIIQRKDGREKGSIGFV